MSGGSRLYRAVDTALDTTIVGGFSRPGYLARRALGGWEEGPDRPRMDGRRVLVTGATSGIGLAAALRFVRMGASVRFLARDVEKAMRTRSLLKAAGGPGADVSYDVADLGDFDRLRRAAERIAEANPRLDVLVHNAGALSPRFRRAPDGTELTLAVHVLGPFLLTSLLLPQLREGGPGRVITMSSGGMYTQRFDLDALEMDPSGYDGRVAYARAKRAQVVLNREWARRVPAGEVVFHTMHPGWVDTPGVEAGLPGFHRVMGPLLRTPDQGADTAVFLASDPAALASTGDFWHDRRRRSEHRLPWTGDADSGSDLWARCERLTSPVRV